MCNRRGTPADTVEGRVPVQLAAQINAGLIQHQTRRCFLALVRMVFVVLVFMVVVIVIMLVFMSMAVAGQAVFSVVSFTETPI
ncbi:MAG: hypothetical protein JKP95_01105 [Oceanicaulis sp.]|nr:hypothetical protein [Oceanicaulis sp.]